MLQPTLFPRHLFARWLGLPPALNSVRVERDISIPMTDGEVLLADHYWPLGTGSQPTVLIRSPWGRGWKKAPFSLLYSFIAQRFAERGYHVLLEDTHQRPCGEDSHPMPHFYEPGDGQDTLVWLAGQEWFNGVLGMWGASYLGYVQWAALSSEIPALKAVAIVPVTTSTRWVSVIHPDRALALDLIFRLQHTLASTQLPIIKMIRAVQKQDDLIAEAAAQLPINAAAKLIPEAPGFDFHSVRENVDPQSPLWQAVDLRESLLNNPAEVHLIAGWYDVFLREQIEDYFVLRAAGKSPYLTIGPWHHTSQELGIFSIRTALSWFDAHLKGDIQCLRNEPVSIYVMGAEEWRGFDRWPPEAKPVSYYLHHENSLNTVHSEGDIPSDRYRYDPRDPTPSISGAVLHSKAGQQDNRVVESRPDVLIYTTQPLKETFELIGTPILVLFVHSSEAHFDCFGRLCDVWPDGRSLNVTDGFVRLKPGDGKRMVDGTLEITLPLWPTAYRFQAGHRLRLQVSSGAHPRWSRNLGTGEPINSGVRMVSSEQSIYHDRHHPSRLILPLVNLTWG